MPHGIFAMHDGVIVESSQNRTGLSEARRQENRNVTLPSSNTVDVKITPDR
jgi:hypothetical protein